MPKTVHPFIESHSASHQSNHCVKHVQYQIKYCNYKWQKRNKVYYVPTALQTSQVPQTQQTRRFVRFQSWCPPTFTYLSNKPLAAYLFFLLLDFGHLPLFKFGWLLLLLLLEGLII